MFTLGFSLSGQTIAHIRLAPAAPSGGGLGLLGFLSRLLADTERWAWDLGATF